MIIREKSTAYSQYKHIYIHKIAYTYKHTNIYINTDTPTKLYTDYLSNITKKFIYIQNEIQKNPKATNNYLCARTCDIGCSFPHVLQGANTHPYIGHCS